VTQVIPADRVNNRKPGLNQFDHDGGPSSFRPWVRQEKSRRWRIIAEAGSFQRSAISFSAQKEIGGGGRHGLFAES